MESDRAFVAEPVDDLDWFTYFRDVYLGFGPPECLVRRCIKRAYLDFNRTWHRARSGADAPDGQRKKQRADAEEAIVKALEAIINQDIDQAKFDLWHRGTRNEVMRASVPAGRGSSLTLGLTQKWINMSVKYAIGGRAPGFERLFALAHVPIDNQLINAMARYHKFDTARCRLGHRAWSKLSDDRVHEQFQCEFRRAAAPKAPLAEEFHLWRDEMTGRRDHEEKRNKIENRNE